MSLKLLKRNFIFAWCTMLCTILQITFSPVSLAENFNSSSFNPSIRIIQQVRVITGRITGDDGLPIPGANILVKGTTLGTTTDADGKYSLSVPETVTTLTYSFIGYKSKDELVSGRAVINIELEPDVTQLAEVQVVGFGYQKKESVVGSLTSVNVADLKVPSSNLTNALAGRIAGVIAYQRSGEPGQDNAQFFIRGVTTFGYKKDPLILIDGVEMTPDDLARLQIDDIASFSIMKDATATAVYGSRGANGIIYVTTKSGVEGKVKIAVRYETSLSQPTQDVELADPVTYMRLHNESVRTRNPEGLIPYNEEKVEKTASGTANPYYYPATDWRKMLIKDYALNHRFNFSLSGGGDVANYYIAGTYTKDNGILNVDKRSDFNSNIDLKRYNMRFNMDIKMTKTTKATLRLQANFDDYTGPIDGGKEVYQKIMRTNPVLFPAYYAPDAANQFTEHTLFGNFESANYINPYADMVRGYKDYSRALTLVQFEIRQKLDFITKGLSYRFLGNNNRLSEFSLLRGYNPYYYQIGYYNKAEDEYTLYNINPVMTSSRIPGGTEFLDYRPADKDIESTFYMENALNYDRVFNDKHSISGLLVMLMRERLEASPTSFQLSLPHRNLGISGRFTYGFKDRYFAEFNFGYNGSERFSKDHRFGFFPSVGAGWMISNESFFTTSGLNKSIDRLKLRGSYGVVGNDAIGEDKDRFFYLSEVNLQNTASPTVFGEQFQRPIPTVSISRYENDRITWEKSYKSNVGLEIGLFNSMNIIAEAFYEYRTHILMERPQISTMGLQADIMASVGKAIGKGFDISLDYQKYFNDHFWVQGRGNFTYATSEVLTYEEPDYKSFGTPWNSRVGVSTNQEYGFIAERLFVDGDSQYGTGEVANSPVQGFGRVMGGDIKYKDINGDDQINDRDKVAIGYPTEPEIVYGFGLSAGYKKLDINAFFQGLSRESFWIDPVATAPFLNYHLYDNDNNNNNIKANNALLKAYADSHWSEETRDLYALWPRLSNDVVTNNNQKSTWFMRDGSFLRLKQVEIGYTPLSADALKKIRATSLRVYANGTNLITWSKFKLWDPEMAGNGLGYPIQRVINVGVQCTF